MAVLVSNWSLWGKTRGRCKPISVFDNGTHVSSSLSFSRFCMKKFKGLAHPEYSSWFDSLCLGGCCGATPQPRDGESSLFPEKQIFWGCRDQPCSSRLDESKWLNRPLLISINHVKGPKISLISYIVACRKCCNTSLRCLNSIK